MPEARAIKHQWCCLGLLDLAMLLDGSFPSSLVCLSGVSRPHNLGWVQHSTTRKCESLTVYPLCSMATGGLGKSGSLQALLPYLPSLCPTPIPWSNPSPGPLFSSWLELFLGFSRQGRSLTGVPRSPLQCLEMQNP